MKNKKWHLDEAIAFYQSQGAPHQKQALLDLLTEVQRHTGGMITQKTIKHIAHAYDVKKSFLRTFIAQSTGLTAEERTHKLRVYGKKSCPKRETKELIDFIMQTYDVKDGGTSKIGDFSFKIISCKKKCHKTPTIKWDGEVYAHASPQLIRDLIDEKNIPKQA